MVYNQNLIDELIVKYARQEVLTDEEVLLLESWCSQSAGHRALPELYREQVKNGKDLRALPPAPLAAIREKVLQSIKKGKEEPVKTPGRSWHWPRWWGTAAIAMATAGFVLLGMNWLIQHYHGLEKTDKKNVVQTPPPDVMKLPLPNGDQVILIKPDGSQTVLDSASGKGDSLVLADAGTYSSNWLLIGRQRKTYTIRLPDGGRIELKHASRLQLPNFEDPQFVAKLEGEGWFDITKNSSRPMSVLGRGGTGARVLGTCFAFCAYPGEELKVSLISGAVQVFHNTESVLLKPDQEAVLKGDDLVEQKMTGAYELLHWSGDTLLFRFQNADLTTVLEEIARWYDLKIDNPAQVRGMRITAVFARNISPEEIVEQIRTAESGAAWLEIRADTIVISRHRIQ